MGEIEVPFEVPPVGTLVRLAIDKLDGVVLEARSRYTHGAAAGTRLVCSLPDMESRVLLGALVEALGGRLEGLPASLALGIALPSEPCLAFFLPADVSSRPPVLRG